MHLATKLHAIWSHSSLNAWSHFYWTAPNIASAWSLSSERGGMIRRDSLCWLWLWRSRWQAVLRQAIGGSKWSLPLALLFIINPHTKSHQFSSQYQSGKTLLIHNLCMHSVMSKIVLWWLQTFMGIYSTVQKFMVGKIFAHPDCIHCIAVQ